MKLYFIAGEASGDAHGAEVMRGLVARAEEHGQRVEFEGAGGPQMHSLAPSIHDWSGEAVVGLWDVLKKYGYFKRQFNAMLREITDWKPDAVVFIDYPGFNLRLAKALRKRLPGLRLIYYISPQVWAWNRRRIPEMARMLNLMLCIFPFEKELYEESGLKTVFVGHPMLDSLARKRAVPAIPRSENLVGLLPGSRMKEVTRIFPVMIATAIEMRRARPELGFEAAAASEKVATVMRKMVSQWAEPAGLAIPITVGSSYQLMQRAAVGMVASGTATMETAYFEMPFVIVYRVAALTWEVGKRLVKVPFLGMVNILAGREIVREFLQADAEPKAIADELLSLLNGPEKREAQAANLREVVAGLGMGGASERAAEAIWEELARN